jgi:putative ABC transport system permease protein
MQPMISSAFMDVLRQDVRSALVAMRRAPDFAATALITLALGVGATTAVFSIVHGVLLRPLPYADPDRLVRLWEEYPGGVSPAGNRWLSRSTYAVWREHTRTLDAVGGYALSDYQVAFGGEGFKVFGAQVSPAVLGTLGVAPALGRLLTDDDDREGAPPVVIVSDRLWRERYGSSPGVLGASLVIDGTPHTIVGVSPRAFEFPDPRVRFWLPYVIPRSAAAPAGAVVFTALARLKPGIAPAQAEAEGTAAARAAPRHRLTELFFGKGGPPVVHARALANDMTATARPALTVLAVAVALVLLIACANVTNILLSRGVTRQRELAIRAAVGGSRARIARQLFTESAVFSIAGSALGLVLAWWLVRLLPAIAPPRLPRLDRVDLDGSVVMFWALTTLLATVAAGFAPAARGARADLSDALRSADRSSDTGFRGGHARRLRDGLLILEAAFAVVLIVGASLLARSFVRLIGVDNGYTADGVLIASVELPRGATEARTDQVIEAALARLRARRDVSAAGAGAMIPLMMRTAIAPFTLPDSVAGGKPTHGRALVYWITPGYAEALGLRLREGRFFDDTDARAGTLATLVNQEFVRQHLAARQVTGLMIPNLVGQEQGVTAEIVGVVGNVLKDGNDRQPQPELYFVHGSHGQRISEQVNLVIRTTGKPAALAQDVRGLVRQVDREAVVDRIEPLTTTVAASLDAPRFATSVVAGFAGVAMVLAVVGLYGVLSYSVSQRVRELAIRAALGAQRVELISLVLRDGLSVTFAGIVLGLLGAGLFTRLMQDLLFGVTPLDAVAFTVAPAVLVVAAFGACLGPALRAASTDPATTLRGS